MIPASIQLNGNSASRSFHQILREAAAVFPDDLDGLIPADPKPFRAAYADLLPRFEARRQHSPHRTAIAAHLFAAGQAACSVDGRPLAEAAAAAAEPLPLATLPPQPDAPLLTLAGVGAAVQRDSLRAWVADLYSAHQLTTDAQAACTWLLDRFTTQPLELSERRVVVLGAGAALSPVALLRQAGATTLWIDRTAPEPAQLPGRGAVHYPAEGADLLQSPERIRATMLAFSGGAPLDICLFAYAQGQGREWRLTAAMNALVQSLPPGRVRTVSMFVSPAIPARLTARERQRALTLRERRPLWKATMSTLGLLGRGLGHVDEGGVAVSRSVISMQGLSYQASQYLGKVMAAEAWCTAARPLHVSANTAAITATPSMDKPMFKVAFRGAPAFGIDIFSPEETRILNGLLMIRDWLDPAAPGNPRSLAPSAEARAAALQRQRIHGGAHGIPYPAEPTIRMCGLVGLTRFRPAT